MTIKHRTINALADQMQSMAERTVARIMAYRFKFGAGTLDAYATHYNLAYFLWDNDHAATNMV